MLKKGLTSGFECVIIILPLYGVYFFALFFKEQIHPGQDFPKGWSAVREGGNGKRFDADFLNNETLYQQH